MTDEVQKIREEVVRMHNLLPVMDSDNISVNYADRICTTLEMYIDSLQEEPNITGIKSKHATGKLKECIDNAKKAKLNAMLDDALSKETKESLNERLEEEKPKFKVGDIIRKINDGLEAKVISIDNSGFIYAACEDWEQIIYPKDWELVEMPISKVWHDVEENPEENRDFAFVDYDGVMWSRYRIEDIYRGWQSYVNMTGMTKWAYTSDLIKL